MSHRFGPRVRQNGFVPASIVRNWMSPSPMFQSVQRGLITIADASTSNTAAITAVDTTRSYVRLTGQDVTVVGVQESYYPVVTLTSGTVVTASRGAADVPAGNALIVGYEVVQYLSGWVRRVQQVSIAITAGNTTAQTAITAIVTAKSELVQRGFTTTAIGADATSHFAYTRIASTTLVEATRVGNSGDRTHGVTVVESF